MPHFRLHRERRFVVNRSARTTDDPSGGHILMHLGTGRIWRVNATGSAVWTHLQRGCSMAEIVDALVAEYDAPRTRIQADVHTFIRLLAKNGFLAERLSRAGQRRSAEHARVRGNRP